ncbi:MAG: hypothetical protein WCS84_08275 [Nocardioides sp.]|jgi:hypothetical protein
MASYGVLVSKTGHLMVETTGAGGNSDTDAALDRFQLLWGGAWVAGRLTLTKLHLTYVPNRAGRGMPMMNLNLRDISEVEIGGGRVSKVIGLRTARHVIHIKCLGAPAIATQIAGLVEDQKRAHRRV